MQYRVADLVSEDASLISRRCWSDPGIYELEKAGIFGKSWLFLGHESQIPVAGETSSFTPTSTAAPTVACRCAGPTTVIPSGLFARITTGPMPWTAAWWLFPRRARWPTDQTSLPLA